LRGLMRDSSTSLLFPCGFQLRAASTGGMDAKARIPAALGGAAEWPLVARGRQPERVRRLAVFVNLPEHDPESERCVAALRQGLTALGWIRTGETPDDLPDHRIAESDAKYRRRETIYLRSISYLSMSQTEACSPTGQILRMYFAVPRNMWTASSAAQCLRSFPSRCRRNTCW
jgi:hypothetical protein